MDKGDFAKGEPSERDGLVRPARLQMAAHSKTGYRVSFGLSLLTLTLFNVTAITVAFMNWETSCEKPMAPVLLWYGIIGMLFVAVLSMHFCYFTELGSCPSKETATLCALLLIIIFGLGGGLIYITVVTRETCRLHHSRHGPGGWAPAAGTPAHRPGSRRRDVERGRRRRRR